MTDNIKKVNFTPDKTKALFEAVKRDMESGDLEERLYMIAKYNKIRYNTHIKAGFTKKQALELIK